MKKLLSLICCIFYITNIFCQGIVIEKKTIADKTKAHKYLEVHTIYNMTNDDYITWLAWYDPKDNEEDKQILYYIYRNWGSTNIHLLISELNMYEERLTEIGMTFMKKIQPHRTFTYIIKKNKHGKSNFYDRIVCIKKEKIEKLIQYKLNDKWLYQPDTITFSENLKLKD